MKINLFNISIVLLFYALAYNVSQITNLYHYSTTSVIVGIIAACILTVLDGGTSKNDN